MDKKNNTGYVSTKVMVLLLAGSLVCLSGQLLAEGESAGGGVVDGSVLHWWDQNVPNQQRTLQQHTRQRIAVLSRMEELTNHLRSHYGPSGYLEALATVAGGVAISALNGSMIAKISRLMSPGLCNLSAEGSQSAAYTVYSMAAFTLGAQLLRVQGIGQPVSLYQHLRYALESVGAGQALGWSGWVLSANLWPRLSRAAPALLTLMLDRARGLRDCDDTGRIEYNHAAHYIASALIGNLWYYLARTILSSYALEQEIGGLEDELAISRALLRQLELEAPSLTLPINASANTATPAAEQFHQELAGKIF